jgi:pilus assembly protein CpaE
MVIYLITPHAKLLEQWRSNITQLGLSLGTSPLRQPGQHLALCLAELADAQPQDLVLIEHPAFTSAQDLRDLEFWLRTRPMLNVLLQSENNSPDLLLQAMKAGVREVLPLTANPKDLLLSLQHWSERLAAPARDATASPPAKASTLPADTGQLRQPGRLVAFMGCKGGNGTSFLAANMAHVMASEFDRQCAFVDLDLQSGDASFYLGSGANKNTLSDLTRQIDRLDAQLLSSCLYAVTPRLNLLAAPHTLDKAMTISAQDIEKVLTLVRSQHDHVVVDLPRTLNALSLKVLDMSDVVYIVMQNQTPDVRDAQRLVHTLLSLGLNERKLRLLVNRYEPDGWVSLAELEKAVGLPVHQTIPNKPQWVGESLHTGQPLSAVNDHNTVMHALRKTSAALLDSPPTRQRHWMQRWLGQTA